MAGTLVSGARENILARVRAALRDVPGAERPEDVAVAREYRRQSTARAPQLVARLEGRLRDYHASVSRVAPDAVGEAVTAAARRLELRRVVVPPELPAPWRPSSIEVIEDRGLDAQALDGIDGAVTGCAAAIAETGTLILDGQGVCGRRLITLVPDHHICVVRAEQVLGLVPEAIERVRPNGQAHPRPVTLVSGPSASSDIELNRVEGVHGPRHLLVLIAG